jgi:hypothetical protein
MGMKRGEEDKEENERIVERERNVGEEREVER